MALPLRIASYWLGVSFATLAWLLAIDALEMWPLPVQLALASMVPMAGFWWHLVLFQDILKARKAARRAPSQLGKPEAAPAAGPAPLPEAALRAALQQVRAEAAAMAWDPALQRELQLRTECDATFARILAPLAESERAVLLLAARGPVVRKRLPQAAELLLRDRGQPRADDPLRQHLQAGLAAIAPALGEDFAMVMRTAGDLDPIAVARHLIAHPATMVERAPLTALLREATALLARDQRPAARSAVAAMLASQVERPLEAMLEAYIATVQAPEAVALAALRSAGVPQTRLGAGMA